MGLIWTFSSPRLAAGGKLFVYQVGGNDVGYSSWLLQCDRDVLRIGICFEARWNRPSCFVRCRSIGLDWDRITEGCDEDHCCCSHNSERKDLSKTALGSHTGLVSVMATVESILDNVRPLKPAGGNLPSRTVQRP